jgi:hypothetical protein
VDGTGSRCFPVVIIVDYIIGHTHNSEYIFHHQEQNKLFSREFGEFSYYLS